MFKSVHAETNSVLLENPFFIIDFEESSSMRPEDIVADKILQRKPYESAEDLSGYPNLEKKALLENYIWS